MTYFNGLVLRLAEDHGAQKATCKRVPRTICIHNLIFGQLGDWVYLFDVSHQIRTIRRLLACLRMIEICGGDKDSRLCAMGQDNYSRPRRIRLGQGCNGSGDRGKVGRRRKTMSVGIGLGFGLVPDYNVTVWQETVELRFEELGDERRGKIRDEDLEQ